MTEQQLKEYAQEHSKTIVIRTYTGGTSYDERRATTKVERQIIENVIFGALLVINRNGDTQAAMDTAEHIGNLFIPEMNGYDTVYNVIRDFAISTNHI